MKFWRIVPFFQKKISEYVSWKNVKNDNKRYFGMLRKSNIPIKKLSSEQKNKIDEIYKKFGFRYTYDTHILAYSVTGKFDEWIMPEDMFRTYIQPTLNDRNYKVVLSDKGYFELYMPEIKFPDCIIKNIDGCFYDADLNAITEEKAKEILAGYDEVVIKPTVENGFGKGVSLVKTMEENPLSLHKKNYIIQKRVVQHKTFSELNESSVNIVRVVTLFLDGEVNVISSALRIGGVGAFTDNAVTSDGKGMIVVGIDENGKLRENGYHSCGLKTKQTPNGIAFLGREVYKLDEMFKIAKHQHVRFPDVKIIGWDFTVDRSGEVVAIEYNLRRPGILYYQYVNGSLFGSLTEKVCSYANEKTGKR